MEDDPMRAMATSLKLAAFAVVGAALLVSVWMIHARFERDLLAATGRAAQGSVMVETRCGPIEVQQAGEGIPLLIVHGSGGGHDQGMAWARPLVQHGVRVIAMSRFGYLRTPRPADASPEAQADAHVCLLDALGISKAAVMGVSAGGPSAMQTAIRHPQRVSALVLVVPIAYKPGAVADSAPAVSDSKDELLLRLLGSDFLFWTALQVARNPLIRHVLATPPEQVATASEAERARVNDLAERILPVSARAAGLRDDTRLGKSLRAYALETIRVPTLVVSARDDGFGTYAAAQYTASRIAGAKFVGFDSGGHLLVGQDAAVQGLIAKLLSESSSLPTATWWISSPTTAPRASATARLSACAGPRPCTTGASSRAVACRRGARRSGIGPRVRSCTDASTCVASGSTAARKATTHQR
jgi:2-hydroxy-6-oxonona-2,4-dienedioate hydrolase